MRMTLRARHLGRADFTAELAVLSAVYAAAMRPPPELLPGRRAIMLRHADCAGFRAIAVSTGTAVAGGPAGGPAAEADRVVAFAYGFRGAQGQWWHDTVRAGLTAARGDAFAKAWLADSMEVAEVHVHPDYQRRGIGRGMLLELTAGRLERTALLSTRDADSPARRLYRNLGFADLLTGFRFPGAEVRYAVMGAVLPLRAARAPRPSR